MNKKFFKDGPVGTGKTFLYKNLLEYIRSKNHIALAVVSSGIAVCLLTGRRTLIRVLKFQLIFFQHQHVLLINSTEAELIRNAKMILWDEEPMMHRHAF